MTEEEALLSEVKDIIDTASEQDDKKYDEYCVKVAREVEQTIWNEYGSLESYELWCLRLRLKSTPEEIANLQEETKDTQSLVIPPEDMEINSCIELALGYHAGQTRHPDLNGLLEDHKRMLILAVRQPEELVGLVARTGAWISNQTETRPSEAQDKESITLTLYMCAGRLVVIPRNDKTQQVIEDGVQVIRYFRPEGEDDQKEMNECCEYLSDNHGRLAANLYAAWAYPRMFMLIDRELFTAMGKDALLKIDNKETEQ